MVMYDNSKTLEKIVQNSYWSVISNRGSFSFSENRDSRCLLPQVRKSILRQAKNKNKPENRYTNFRTTLYNKIRYSIKSWLISIVAVIL
jgi:hypothetical protein